MTETGNVGSISVTLLGVTSEAPDDLDVYLSSPAGTKVMLWSDAGGDDTRAPIDNPIDVGFSDGAPSGLPDDGPIAAGSYKPTNHPAANDFFCMGEADPAGTFASALSAFAGQPANGTWSLVLADDCTGFTSQVGGGWRLTLNAPTAVGVVGLSARPVRGGGVALRWRTVDETAVLGFELVREDGSKVGPGFLRARWAGRPRGAPYALVDRRARRAEIYRLQLVRPDGSRVWAGAAAFSARFR